MAHVALCMDTLEHPCSTNCFKWVLYALHVNLISHIPSLKCAKLSDVWPKKETQSFSNWLTSDKRSQAYRWNTPHFFLFFEKDTSSDLWEVATCLSKLLWMMDDSIPIFLFAHHCWNCASLRLGAVGNGASKYISSRSLLIHPSWIERTPFPLRLADLTRWSRHIFLGRLRD